MLDISRVDELARTYTPQEMFAAMVYQNHFNCMNGVEVITDLANNTDLWRSFIYGKPVYSQNDYGIGFSCQVQLLLHLANEEYITPPPEPFFSSNYPGDNLFILTEDDEEKISRLLALGDKWQLDETYVVKSCTFKNMYDPLEPGLDVPRSFRLYKQLKSRDKTKMLDGVVVCMWWD